MTLRKHAKTLAGTGLLLGALWQGTAAAQAPAALPTAIPAPPTKSAAPVPTLPANMAPGPVVTIPPMLPGPVPAPEDRFNWASVPPVQPLTIRPGYFPVQPTGPGYYTALDWLKGEERQSPPKYPYPRFSLIFNSFFDYDWRYLDDPKNTDHDFFDCLKRQRFANDTMMFTTGGEFRYRYNNEQNSRLFNGTPAGLRGSDNTYDLTRVRVYGDLWITDNFRIFAEVIDAQSFNQDLPPQAVDRNWTDLLNAFIDMRTLTIADSPIWVRVGRQELAYGSQRLISPLDWVNTRRTFQGVKAFWQSESFSVDAFLVQPVVPVAGKFDSVDNNQLFSGLWTTYRPNKNQNIDAYALNLDRSGPAFSGQRGLMGAGNFTTLGSRYVGRQDNWLWDVEGMFQFGTYSDQTLVAQASTVSGGYFFADTWATPSVWVGYDYASGDNSPGVGSTRRTFQQLFPFGHPYFGFIDVVGRQNIQDLSLVATAYPTNWITTQAQMHNFYLANPRDALYNAGGAAIRSDPTGRAGRFVGQEADFLVNFHLTNHQDILISYSHLFAGEFLRRTAASPNGRADAEALYIQYSYKW